MYLRSILVATCFAFALYFLSTPALLADSSEPSSAELFEQGMGYFEDGQYAEAKKAFNLLVPAELTSKQRKTMWQTLKEADARLHPGDDAVSLLEQADRARNKKKLAQAVLLYQQVEALEQSTPRQKALVRSRLAEVRRSLQPQVAQMRRWIDAADQDIKADRLADASEKLAAVKKSGVDLGWFDNRHVDRLMAVVEERRRSFTTAPPALEMPPPPALEVTPEITPEVISEMTPAVIPGVTPEMTTEVAHKIAPQAPHEAYQELPDQQQEEGQVPVLTEEGEKWSQSPPEPVHEHAMDDHGEEETAPEMTGEPMGIPMHEPDHTEAPADEELTVQPVEPSSQDRLREAIKLYAQQQMAEGQAAEDSGQYYLAIRHYQKATQYDPSNLEAAIALTRVRDKAQQMTIARGPLQRQRETMKLQRGEAIAEYQQLINQAHNLRSTRRFKEALEAVQQAKAVLDRNRNVVPTDQYNDLRHDAEELDAAIDQERREAEAQEKITIEKDNLAAEAQQRMEALAARHKATQNALRRAIELRSERRYDEALTTLTQALFRDPNNVAAQALKDMIEIDQVTFESLQIQKERDREFMGQLMDNQEATIPHQEILQYPPDWPTITRTRLGAAEDKSADSAVNRRTEQLLRESRQAIDFSATPLVQVIEVFRNNTGVNFYPNWSALREAGIDEETTINLKLTDVAAEDALLRVVRQISTDLDPVDYTIDKGIVEISTKRDLTSTTVTRTYDMQDLLIQVPRFTDAPSFDLDSALGNVQAGGDTSSGGSSGGGGGGGGRGGGGGGSSGGGGSGSGGGIFGNIDAQDEGADAVARQERIDKIMDLIRDNVGHDPNDWFERGGQISSLTELNGLLVVKTTSDNQKDVDELLDQLRESRAIMINVEARFLLVDQNFLEDIGADLDLVIDNIGSRWGPITISQDSFGLASPVSTGLSSGFGIPAAIGDAAGGAAEGGSGRAFDLSLSYIDDLQVNLLIRATQASRRSVTLTAPRLSLMNGQRAYVLVARDIAFVSSVTAITNGVGFNQELSSVISGVVLEVEATVSADRRYVTMTTEPRLSTVIRPIRQIAQTAIDTIDSGDQDTAGQPLTASSFVEAPEIEITEVKTTVSVPDKGTLLLGGQRLVGEIEVEAGVPVISKIPFLNRLFTNRSKVKDERTLLILIKPTIIIQSEQEEHNFPGLLNNPDQYYQTTTTGRAF